jgi:hypothetical protein
VPHTHWVGRGTGTPKDKDEVNKRVEEVKSFTHEKRTDFRRFRESLLRIHKARAKDKTYI